jgi:glycosyltransferase involved in cell wall biosynthesis
MRILFFTQFYPPEVGATQTRMQHFAQRLVENGHHVTVIAEMPNHPKGIIFEGYRSRLVQHIIEDGIEVIRIWVYASPRKTFLRRMLFYNTYMLHAILAGLCLARGRYDVIFATSPPLPVVFSAYLVSRMKHCPFVMDVRDIWPAVGVVLGEIRGQAIIRGAEKLERFLYAKAAAVTCVTRRFVDDVIGKGADSAKVSFLPNGTIPELFNPQHSDGELRRKLGLEGKFVVGFCGNHGVAQGLPEILEAARLLKDRDEFRFLFVGEGPVKSYLLEMKARDELHNVLFLPQVPISEIAPYINAADIMLVPLRKDDIFTAFIPSKMFDFMACGKPIILGVDGEARAILEASGGGVYVAPDNPHALASALSALSENADLLSDMGRRGREYVLQHYVRDQQVEYLEEILAAVARLTSPCGDIGVRSIHNPTPRPQQGERKIGERNR